MRRTFRWPKPVSMPFLMVHAVFSATGRTRSSTGRIIDGEYLSLPLAGKDGTADRIVVHLAVLKTLGYGDESVDIGEQTLVSVIDLGGQMPTFSDGITPSQLLERSSAALS